MLTAAFRGHSRLCASSSRRCFSSLQVPHRTQLFIDNEWRDAEGGRVIEVSDPSTEQELFKCARASPADVSDAVTAARRCFRGVSWGKQSKSEDRAEMLRKMSVGLAEKKEEFAVLECMDNGKPINEARADMDACIGLFDYYSKLAVDLDAQKEVPVQTQDADFGVRLVKEPAGVVGMVTPWNYPLMQAVVKVAPAIAAGCSMVLKPSSVCPATCLRLGDLALEAGLPAGALNIINGTGSEAGSALLDHRHVDRLSFTGSSSIGHVVMHAAAKRLVHSSMELGGKGALVVFDDVDVEVAVDWIMIGIFMTTGQCCSATSRLLVHRNIEDRLLQRLTEEARKLRMGPTLDERTQLGALTSQDQLDTVSGFVERALADGGEVLCGGRSVQGVGGVADRGFYYEATVLRCGTQSEAWREEIFGPVLAVQSFETEEEAVELANDTEYGLSNGVLTNDPERCERIAQQLHSGIVWKNCSNAIPVESPFGGFGKSGFGKEYGEMGLEEYLQTKVITGVKPGFSWQWYVNKTNEPVSSSD